MNIEKEFISTITAQFPEGSKLVYHLLEHNAIDMRGMERYLIKAEFKSIMDKNRRYKTMMAIYSDLSEKYSKSFAKIRYILK